MKSLRAVWMNVFPKVLDMIRRESPNGKDVSIQCFPCGGKQFV